MSGYSPETLRARPNGAIFSPEPAACPKLGLADDRMSHAMFAVPQHRCFAATQPSGIPADHQRRYCLSARHRECPVFQGQPPPWRHRVPSPVHPLSASRRLRPSRTWLARRPLAALGLAVGVIAIGGAVALLRPRQAKPQVTGTGATVQPSPAVVATLAPTVAATQAPVSTTPTPEPTVASPTATAAVATPSVTRYTVRPGDSLSELADQFGVSLAALAGANTLAPTASLDIGQVLVIPTARATPTPTGGR